MCVLGMSSLLSTSIKATTYQVPALATFYLTYNYVEKDDVIRWDWHTTDLSEGLDFWIEDNSTGTKYSYNKDIQKWTSSFTVPKSGTWKVCWYNDNLITAVTVEYDVSIYHPSSGGGGGGGTGGGDGSGSFIGSLVFWGLIIGIILAVVVVVVFLLARRREEAPPSPTPMVQQPVYQSPPQQQPSQYPQPQPTQQPIPQLVQPMQQQPSIQPQYPQQPPQQYPQQQPQQPTPMQPSGAYVQPPSQQAVSPKKCPKCGATIQEGWKTCPFCNTPLT